MVTAYLEFIKSLFFGLPFTVFDYILFGALALYVFEDASYGLVASAINLAATVLAFFMGLIFYPAFSNVLVEKLTFTKGLSDAVSFLAVSSLGFVVLSFAFSLLRRRYISVNFPKQVDMLGGALFGAISFFFIASFIVALLLSFPTSGVIKDSIRNSVTGKFLSTHTRGLDSDVRKIFGGAIEDTINFLTVEPGSNQSVGLNFKTNSSKVDAISENRMFELINQERVKVGRVPLTQDESLTKLAREHAKDMLAKGYFSHYTPGGLSPFDRMAMDSITYQYAGENLAFAPDGEIAMDGLMKSQGHRDNMLSPNFGKVGIGVLDAGIFGKMFVQEFTD